MAKEEDYQKTMKRRIEHEKEYKELDIPECDDLPAHIKFTQTMSGMHFITILGAKKEDVVDDKGDGVRLAIDTTKFNCKDIKEFLNGIGNMGGSMAAYMWDWKCKRRDPDEKEE